MSLVKLPYQLHLHFVDFEAGALADGVEHVLGDVVEDELGDVVGCVGDLAGAAVAEVGVRFAVRVVSGAAVVPGVG